MTTQTERDPSLLHLAPFVGLLEHLADVDDYAGVFVVDLLKELKTIDVKLLDRAWIAALVLAGEREWISTGIAPPGHSHRARSRIIAQEGYQWSRKRVGFDSFEQMLEKDKDIKRNKFGIDAVVVATKEGNKVAVPDRMGLDNIIIQEPDQRVWVQDE